MFVYVFKRCQQTTQDYKATTLVITLHTDTDTNTNQTYRSEICKTLKGDQKSLKAYIAV